MSEINVIKAVFNRSKYCRTERRFQWDKGQVLKFEGIELPTAYRVDFSVNSTGGTAVSQLGNSSGVSIPNAMFEYGKNIFAWVVLSEDESDERSVYVVEIPVIKRSEPVDTEITGEDATLIQQAIAALNAAQFNISVNDDDYLVIEEGES